MTGFVWLSSQGSSESLLDGEALESVKELVSEEMEEGIEALSANVVGPLTRPLADDLLSGLSKDAISINQYFQQICESKLPSLSVSDIAESVSQSAGVNVSAEQLESAVATIRASGASSLVSSALGTQFWKIAMGRVISVVAKDFAVKAAAEVAEMARDIFEEKMKKELTKLTDAEIEEIHASLGEAPSTPNKLP